MEIKLTEEMFIGLLQGKKLQQIVHLGGGETKEWTIYPPHYGLYLTHAQIAELKSHAYQSGLMHMVDYVDSLTKNKTL